VPISRGAGDRPVYEPRVAWRERESGFRGRLHLVPKGNFALAMMVDPIVMAPVL